jgi:hypothetical protein
MLPTLLGVLIVAVLYWFPLRRWFGRWGTTRDDLTRVMSSDAIIVHPTHSAARGGWSSLLDLVLLRKPRIPRLQFDVG